MSIEEEGSFDVVSEEAVKKKVAEGSTSPSNESPVDLCNTYVEQRDFKFKNIESMMKIDLAPEKSEINSEVDESQEEELKENTDRCWSSPSSKDTDTSPLKSPNPTPGEVAAEPTSLETFTPEKVKVVDPPCSLSCCNPSKRFKIILTILFLHIAGIASVVFFSTKKNYCILDTCVSPNFFAAAALKEEDDGKTHFKTLF